jgi:hypothetical protein
MWASIGVRFVFGLATFGHVCTKQIAGLVSCKNGVRRTKKLLLINVLAFVSNLALMYPIADELIAMEGDIPTNIVVISWVRSLLVIVMSVTYILLYKETDRR